MDYKDTLNLPKTDFSMKADLPNREPQILQRWKDAAIYKRIMEKYADKKKYILHDGPPYANGNIHIGHALNKILKDIVVKFQTMQGRHAPYIPGWDCHGLPVEHQLFKELGIDKAGIDQLMFRKKAHKYAMKFVEIQKGEFERLGVFADWDNPYLTLDPEYEYGILTAFMELVKKGYIYKGLKPVNWCVNCETALAEAEVEYDMHKSTSVYVKFKLRSKSKETLRKITSYELRITDYDIYFLIWTTTPWTLVANVAITLNPLFKYSAVKTGGGILIMASDLVSRTMDAAGVKEYEVIEEMDGKSLEGLICGHPFIERDSKVVMGEYVSMEEGTGCVHTAPGHGQEDYETGLKYGLPVIMPVDGKGRFDNTAEEFSGMNIYDAGPKIVERLKKDGNLFHTREIEHSYPHCWRCGKPIAFRATSQWFMKIDHDDLRKKMIAAAGSAGKEGLVRWIPEQGRKRISSMLQSRPDWCLSRQRFWGVPIPVFYCKGCGEEILDPAVIENVAKLVRKEGSDSWFARPPAELMPEGYRCRKCKGTTFEKEKDILDVWFDSGVSHTAVLKTREDLAYPADIYLEGSDQHRGWFQTSLISAMSIYNKPPFRTVLTHGFVVDSEGKKMSKSLGNVIAPQDVQKKYGVDILRLWVASSEYYYDIKISEEILQRLADAYRKIRNTCRFILGNISDFNPDNGLIEYKRLLDIDKYALSMCRDMFIKAEKGYEEFAYHTVYHTLYNFCTIQMSNFYMDILKDRLYTYGRDSLERRSAQTALYHILDVLVRVMAPILPFTAEEVWGHIPNRGEDSVHLASWPARSVSEWDNAPVKEKWGAVSGIRPIAFKALENERIAKNIGNALEADVVLYVKEKGLFDKLDSMQGLLSSLFIVSSARAEYVKELPHGVFVDAEYAHAGVKVGKAKGAKCARCWNYSESVGRSTEHPSACARCIEVLAE